MNMLKKIGLACGLACVLVPAVASAADVFSCTSQLVKVPARQSCNGTNAAWVASGQGLAVTLSASRMNTAKVTAVTTQGFDLDRLAIGGCVAFRQSAGSNTSPRCRRTVGFHQTTQTGG
jgi:hypothetical protein